MQRPPRHPNMFLLTALTATTTLLLLSSTCTGVPISQGVGQPDPPGTIDDCCRPISPLEMYDSRKNTYLDSRMLETQAMLGGYLSSGFWHKCHPRPSTVSTDPQA